LLAQEVLSLHQLAVAVFLVGVDGHHTDDSGLKAAAEHEDKAAFFCDVEI
jgi:hypothetical protein